MDITKRFNHISLCAGYGGIDMGLARAIRGMRTIAYSEIELYAIENLVSKMENGMLEPAPIWTNLKTFPFSKFRGSVDFISGGFPCQPFSSHGARRGDTDPRHLFPFIKNGIVDAEPAFVFLENVTGIINSKLQGDEWADPPKTPVLLHVCRELERIGYEVEWGTFSAREVGLPHFRRRVFILGKRGDIENHRLKEFSKHIQNTIEERELFDGERQETMGVKKRILDQESASPCFDKRLLQRLDGRDFRVEEIKSERVSPPSGRDRSQHPFEPRRTIDKGSCKTNAYKSEVDRDVNGASNWMDYEKLCNSFSDITGELNLLGNGVVPATAEIAFKTLFNRFLDNDNR